jgi:Ca2+-binding RTX toxin-like protein
MGFEMALFNWSSLVNNQLVTFNPLMDELRFDDPSIPAAAIGLFSNSFTNGPTSLSFGGKTVQLSVGIKSLTTSNLTFANGTVLVFGDNSTDTNGDDLANTLTGTAGDDQLVGLGGNDTVNGGAGNDFIQMAYSSPGLFGNDVIDGGVGYDTLGFSTPSSAPITANLATHTAGNASQGTATITSIEAVNGTAGADVFIGGDIAHATDSTNNRIGERFRGNDGADSITGGAGVDFYAIADYANNTALQAVYVNLGGYYATDGRGFTDTLVNIDAVRGGAGNDILIGGGDGRSGNGYFFESFRGNAGNDVFNGNNAGFDPGITFDEADYSNNGSAQAVIVNLATGVASDGLGGTDTLIDIDFVVGGAGADSLTGGAGDESLDGYIGNDTLDGGAGIDIARFQSSTAGVIVNLSAAAITVNGTTVAAGTANDGMNGIDTLIAIESVRGSDFDDYLRGSDNVGVIEYFQGDSGNDIIDGGAGIDFASFSAASLLLGGITATLANGSATISDRLGGTDTLVNIEGLIGTSSNDTLAGGAGDQLFRGQGGSDTINGGAGSDWTIYDSSPLGVTVDLAGAYAVDGFGGQLNLAGIDTLISIENVVGSHQVDRITGDSSDNIFESLGGADVLIGGGGSDTASYRSFSTSVASTGVFVDLANNYSWDGLSADYFIGISNLIGSAGNDFLLGDASNNVFETLRAVNYNYVDGRGGNDTISYESSTTAASAYLSFQYGTNGATPDYLVSVENATGSALGDTLVGDTNNNVLRGLAGNDYLSGSSGTDTLQGGTGSDLIFAGTGTVTFRTTRADMVGGDADYISGFNAGDVISFSSDLSGQVTAQQSGADVLLLVTGLADGGYWYTTVANVDLATVNAAIVYA